jgi:hypothetical protein
MKQAAIRLVDVPIQVRKGHLPNTKPAVVPIQPTVTVTYTAAADSGGSITANVNSVIPSLFHPLLRRMIYFPNVHTDVTPHLLIYVPKSSSEQRRGNILQIALREPLQIM